jgi:phosphate transport system substrate-binding protein
VGKITTPGARSGALGLMLIGAAACGPASEPDPRAIARTLVERPSAGAYDRPVLAVAVLDRRPTAPPATPAGETAALAASELRVAIGQNAAHAFDRSTTGAFSATSRQEFVFDQRPDREACDLVMSGRANFAVIGGSLSAAELHAGLQQTRLGVELFALVVPPQSPIRSLPRAQVRQILTGQVTQWRQLGYQGGTIVVVTPAEGELADRAARALITGDRFAQSAVRVGSTQHVADQLLQHPEAIGVVRVAGAPMLAGMKTVMIDWCQPTAEAFTYGTYPYGIAVELVTKGAPSGEANRLLEFARRDDGRERLGRTLLVP